MKRFIILFLLVAFVFAGLFPISTLAAGEASEVSPPYQNPSPYAPRISGPDVPIWEEWGYGSLEEFLKFFDMTEEEYREFEETQKRYLEEQVSWAEEYKGSRIEEFEELGGVYGIVNVMLNGKFIAFSGAVPKIIHNSAFVPADSLFEAMGARVSFDSRTSEVTVEFANRSLRFILNQDVMIVEENGEESELSIALAPYDEDGVPYIPVRAVSEALGYDVFWDSEFRTVVLLDKEGIIAEIDKDFTILNKLFEMPIKIFPDKGSAYKTIVDILVSFTQLDSSSDEIAVNVGANINIHSDGRNFYLKIAVDLSELLDFILAVDGYDYYSDEEIKEMSEAFDLISTREIELIYNYDKDILYAKIPFIHLFVPEIPEDVWISVNVFYKQLIEAGLDDLIEQFVLSEITNGLSVGKIIYSEIWDYDQINIYGRMMDGAEEFKAWAGDEKFKQDGTDYTLSLTQDDIYDYPDSPDESSYSLYDTFELKLTIKTDNGAIIGAAGNIQYSESYIYLTEYTVDFDISAGNIQFSFEAYEKDAMKVRIDVGAETKATAEPVPQAPPADAKIISIEELFPDQFDSPAIVPGLLEMLSQ